MRFYKLIFWEKKFEDNDMGSKINDMRTTNERSTINSMNMYESKIHK